MAIQQPRPLLMGTTTGSATIKERTMREQVEAYLVRMRHALPFPCTSEELYFNCVPPAVKQWYDEGLFEMDGPLPGKATNLLGTMYATPMQRRGQFGSLTMRPNILHVSVESAEEFLEAQRGNRGHEKIFWFEAPPHVPMPRNSAQTPFFLPEDHPQHGAIDYWVKQAFLIEDEIQTSLSLIERYQACVQTAAQVVSTWPELLNFITVKRSGGAPPKQASNLLREKAAAVMRPTDKEALTTQLARAVMLPETRPRLQAWVKFYTQEIGT